MLLLGSSCLAQGLTVRVINANNGHPLSNEAVTMSLLYMKGEKRPVKYNALLTAKTHADGEAHFTLPTPAPVNLAAQIHLKSPYWHCRTCLVFAAPEDVIQKGVVAPLPLVRSKKAAAALSNQSQGKSFLSLGPFLFSKDCCTRY
jgi:hypothetical protein